MTVKQKHIIFSLAASAGTLAIVTPLIVVAAKRNSQKTTVQPTKQLDYSIFPKLNPKDYYKYIYIDKNEPKFNSNIVPAITKDVFKNMTMQNGQTSFDYEFVKPTLLKLYFVWVNNNERKEKCYTFEINYDKLDSPDLTVD